MVMLLAIGEAIGLLVGSLVSTSAYDPKQTLQSACLVFFEQRTPALLTRGADVVSRLVA